MKQRIQKMHKKQSLNCVIKLSQKGGDTKKETV